jgi:hypothetical protein
MPCRHRKPKAGQLLRQQLFLKSDASFLSLSKPDVEKFAVRLFDLLRRHPGRPMARLPKAGDSTDEGQLGF